MIGSFVVLGSWSVGLKGCWVDWLLNSVCIKLLKRSFGSWFGVDLGVRMEVWELIWAWFGGPYGARLVAVAAAR